MASPDVRPGISAFSAVGAPPRSPEAPTLPKPETRSAPTVFPERRKPPSKKRLGLYFRLAGALLAIAGAGAPAVKYHFDFNTPNTLAGIVTNIKGIPLEVPYTIAKWQQDKAVDERLNKPVLSTFSNEAYDQIIQADINAMPVSQGELPYLLKDSIKPLEKGKFPDLTILLPVRLRKVQKIEVRTDWADQAWNPIVQKPGLEYGKIITIAQRGTEIIVPVENAEVSIGMTNVREKDYVSSFLIRFKGPDGTIYGLLLYSPEDIRGLQPTDIMNKALAAGEKTISLPIGTTIAVTNFDSLEMHATMYTHPVDYPTGDYSRDLRSNYSLVTKEENGRQVIVFLPQ